MFTQHQGLSCFDVLPCQHAGMDVQEAGRGHNQESWDQLTTITHSAIKTWKRRNRECWCLSSQVTITCEEVVLSWGWLNIRNSLFCFAGLHSFYLPYKTVFISIHGFSHFYPSSSLPYPLFGEWRSSQRKDLAAYCGWSTPAQCSTFLNMQTINN